MARGAKSRGKKRGGGDGDDVSSVKTPKPLSTEQALAIVARFREANQASAAEYGGVFFEFKNWDEELDIPGWEEAEELPTPEASDNEAPVELVVKPTNLVARSPSNISFSSSRSGSKNAAGNAEASRPRPAPAASSTAPLDVLSETSSESEAPEATRDVPGAYNPKDWEYLKVSSEVKKLFEEIQKFKPKNVELDTVLKPFIPEHIPSLGEMDCGIAPPLPPVPRKSEMKLKVPGFELLREPALAMTEPEELLKVVDVVGVCSYEKVLEYETCFRRITVFRMKTIMKTCLLAADVGLDLFVLQNFIRRELYVFASICVAIIVLPQVICWAFLWSYGMTSCWNLLTSILQIEGVLATFISMYRGRTTHSLFWVQVVEGAIEAPTSALLTLYAMLLEQQDDSYQLFLTLSFISSCINIGKAVTTLDTYARTDIPLLQWGWQWMQRSVEVIFRITSLAVFGYMTRSDAYSIHENHQVMVFLVLFHDFMVMLGLLHYANRKNTWAVKTLFAIVMMLCSPPAFLVELRRTSDAYVMIRVGELVLMVGIALFLSPWGSDHTQRLLEEYMNVVYLLAGSGAMVVFSFICSMIYSACRRCCARRCSCCSLTACLGKLACCGCCCRRSGEPDAKEASELDRTTGYQPLLAGSRRDEDEDSRLALEEETPELVKAAETSRPRLPRPAKEELLLKDGYDDSDDDEGDDYANLTLQEIERRANAALGKALEDGDPILSGLLIGDGANPNAILEESGQPALHMAVRIGDLSLCRVLMNHGAELQLTDTEGASALHVAVSLAQESVVRLLLQQRAEVNARDSEGETPLARLNRKIAQVQGGAGEAAEEEEDEEDEFTRIKVLLEESGATEGKGLRKRMLKVSPLLVEPVEKGKLAALARPAIGGEDDCEMPEEEKKDK